MKRGVNLAAVCAVAMTGYCFYPSKPATSITLEEAVSQKKVELICTGTGDHSGSSMELLVTNKSDGALHIQVPQGTLFIANHDAEQNLIMPEAATIVLAKGQKKKALMPGFCTELHDKAPDQYSAFALSKTSDAKMKKLVDYIHQHPKLNEDDVQEAIWCVSDGSSVSGICNDTSAEVDKLRAFVCALTGQKDTWYDTPMDRTVTPERIISNVPMIVSGMLEFETTEAIQVKSEIRDAQGKVITSNPETMSFPKGKFHFDFKITVKGWEKGKYTVLYYTPTKTLIKQEFEI